MRETLNTYTHFWGRNHFSGFSDLGLLVEEFLNYITDFSVALTKLLSGTVSNETYVVPAMNLLVDLKGRGQWYWASFNFI